MENADRGVASGTATPLPQQTSPIYSWLYGAHLLPLVSQNALLVRVERACRHATLASPLYPSLSRPRNPFLHQPYHHHHQQKPAISVSPPPANQIAQPLCGPQEPAVTCRGESQLHLRMNFKKNTRDSTHTQSLQWNLCEGRRRCKRK